MIALSLLLAALVACPLLTALTAAATSADSSLCESCRRRPGVRLVVAGGVSFLVCEDCASVGAR